MIQTLRRKFEYDIDDYYGYMFHIPLENKPDVDKYLSKYGIELVDDPNNDDWYYLSIF